MILQGFRCDHCGIETAERQGLWYQIQVAHVQQHHADGWIAGDWHASFRPNVQLCSRECAAAWFTTTEAPGPTNMPLAPSPFGPVTKTKRAKP